MLAATRPMSEFKYACPVCGQHMMCDSSQSGSVMECPTCFQKIVAPQAPTTDDPKFILTGVKFTEKKIPDTLVKAAAAAGAAPEKPFPLTVVIVLALVLGAGAAAFAFRGKIFKSADGTAPTNSVAAAAAGQPKPKPPEKPPLVAPPANEASWTLSLNTNPLPDSVVSGRIHQRDFIIERATFQNGTLTLRYGTRGPVDFGVQIGFGGAQPESLSGQSINVTTDAVQAARVTLCWKENAEIMRGIFTNSYAMRLEFGPLANNRLPGKIYLCTPDDEKSFVLGSFNADARKPKPKAPPKK